MRRWSCYSYFNNLASHRKIDPKEDLITALLNAEVDGERLSERRARPLLSCCSLSPATRPPATPSPHGMVALSEHPEQKQRLLDDPSLINTAVEEILRWATPVMHFRRQATAPTQIGDQKIGEDEKVVFWHISANRDETVFDDPTPSTWAAVPTSTSPFGGGAPTSAWAPTWPAWR